MTDLIGGLRDRLITENIRNLIEDCLGELNWTNTPNSFIKNSLTIVSYPIDDNMEIEPNLVSVSSEDTVSDEAEMGSLLSEVKTEYAIDIFAENFVSGKHLAGDIRAILEGRFFSIGRYGPVVDILDLRQATPSVLFSVELENISSGKQRFYNKPFQKYWWTIVFDVVDYYDNDE